MLRYNHQKKLLKIVADAYHTFVLDILDVFLLKQHVYSYNAFLIIMYLLEGTKVKLKEWTAKNELSIKMSLR